jgi:AbrB family looped-hinge helix DNA binding protein
MTTTLGKKGQIVIPGELRKLEMLRPGDDFQIFRSGPGLIILQLLPREMPKPAVKLRNDGDLPLLFAA